MERLTDKLEYPQMKADIDLCYEQLFEICRGERDKATMCMPHQETDFDNQFSAAFDELKAYRDIGKTPEELAELIKAQDEGRLVVLPCNVHEKVYRVVKDAQPHIVKDRVTSFVFTEFGENCKLIDRDIPLLSFGKTVFLTREEAERAIQDEISNI